MPKLSEVPIEVDEDEETIKIVQLVKSSDPTGQHKSSEPIVVSASKIQYSGLSTGVPGFLGTH